MGGCIIGVGNFRPSWQGDLKQLCPAGLLPSELELLLVRQGEAAWHDEHSMRVVATVTGNIGVTADVGVGIDHRVIDPKNLTFPIGVLHGKRCVRWTRPAS